MLMKAKFKAFLIHFGGSLLLALAALALVYGLWYPPPLAAAVGVTAVFLIVLGVDVCIGPLLTFVVYRPGKKTLRFDLAVIILLQMAAFAYGVWTVAQGRPAWLVFSVDRFDLVRALDLDDRYLDRTAPAYRRAPWLGPRWVAARMPADVEARNQLLFEATMAGVDLPQRPDLYRPLADEAAALRGKAQPLDALLSFNPPAALAAARARWPRADAWLPLMSNVQPMVVLVRKESAEAVAVVDLRPWQ